MRIAVLGGTRFIGAAAVEELVAAGHDVLVVHRGATERDDLPVVPHAHVGRHDAAAVRAALDGHGAECVVDTCAYTRRDAQGLVAALPAGCRAVVLSSHDVYRAFATLRDGGAATDPIPIDESGPTRGPQQRYLFAGAPPHPGQGVTDTSDYENLDVEDVVLRAGLGVLRLPQTYGERDPMRRQEPILRRLRGRRTRIPVGAGTWVWTAGYVRDIARAIRLAAETGAGDGRALNLGERRTPTMAQWAAQVLAAADSDAELVRVPDDVVPADLWMTTAVPQPFLVDSAAARATLGWEDSDAAAALRATVAWHLAHPPPDPDADFAADDVALGAAG